MTEYLDGTTPYHRHGGLIHSGPPCSEAGMLPASAVHVFDPSGLDAHDDAVRHAHEQGSGTLPVYVPDVWDWCWVTVGDPVDEPSVRRVMAGWTTDGTFHRYVSVERILTAVRSHLDGFPV